MNRRIFKNTTLAFAALTLALTGLAPSCHAEGIVIQSGSGGNVTIGSGQTQFGGTLPGASNGFDGSSITIISSPGLVGVPSFGGSISIGVTPVVPTPPPVMPAALPVVAPETRTQNVNLPIFSFNTTGPVSPVDQNRPSIFLTPASGSPVVASSHKFMPRIAAGSGNARLAKQLAAAPELTPLTTEGAFTLYQAHSAGKVVTSFGTVLAKPDSIFAVTSGDGNIRIFNLTAMDMKFVLPGGQCVVMNPGTELFLSHKAVDNPRLSDDGIARRPVSMTTTIGDITAYFTQYGLVSMLKRPELRRLEHASNAGERDIYQNICKTALATLYMYGADGFKKEPLTASAPANRDGRLIAFRLPARSTLPPIAHGESDALVVAAKP